MSQNPSDPARDSVTAPGTYSQVASVLAGFAFTAVILVLQASTGDQTSKELVAIAFMIAFFGCIAAAFNFAAISGQHGASARSFTMGLFAGGGFGISTLYMFWGLVVLMSIFISPTLTQLAFLLFIGVTLVAPIFLVVAALDVARHAGAAARWRLIVACAYTPILFAIVFRLLVRITPNETASIITAGVSLLLIGIGAVMTVVSTQFPRSFSLKLWMNTGWIALHSLVFALLVVLLPSI